MELVELTECVGVECRGVDLRRGWSAEEIDRLRAEWHRRHLLLLRGPALSGEDQLAFVGRFGPLIAERGLWGYVSNVRPDGIVAEGALLFHSDFAFTPAPTLGISLHALAVPADGAPTLFANAVRAAAVLPDDLRQRLEGRRVLNLYDFHKPNDAPMRERDANPGSPRFAHPVVGRHPRTGVPVVFANEMHSDRIMDIPEAESTALLSALFSILYDDSNVYEHRWKVGDLILWDNIALHHGRRTIPLNEPRTLQRVTLGDYTPGELVPDLTELLKPV